MTNKSIPTLLLVSCLAALSACAGDVDDGDALRSTLEGAVTPATPQASAPAEAVPTAVAAAPAPSVRDWRPWVEAEVTRVRAERPDYFDQVMTLPVRSTRAGFPRLTGPLVRDPDAAPILLHRLLTKAEASDVRAAIVDALPRTSGDFSAAAAELLTLETDVRVRELLCASLQHAQAPYALEGLARGLQDSSATVRAEALRSLGSRADDGAELSPAIIAALSDPDVAAQQAAARALGNLQVESAADALIGRLSSSDPDVRRHSLRALSRVAPERTRTLPQLQTLRSDADPGVARLAEALATASQ